MLIIILVASIATIIILRKKIKKVRREESRWTSTDGLEFGISATCVVAIVTAITVVIVTAIIAKGQYIPEKIEMYETENTQIETDIDDLVTNYEEHETDIFKNVTSESVITLVQLYPDLRSNELVTKEIGIYTSNNKKIKSLKSKLIDVNVAKWWLYFNIGYK